ncbi:MAG: fructosamine kinase family protein, partial [Myxococcota bacterium]|nr:fructosamine kinase family protein [Myxococcota bacterium]
TLNDDRPIVFDPAYATAHRELDLGMSLLFGGFSDDFYRAYEAIYPPQPGWRQRVPLHQLYYVLAHYHLFGAPYDEQALDIVTAFL